MDSTPDDTDLYPVVTAEPDNDEDDRDDAALVSSFEEFVKTPNFLMATFRQMSADRAYVYRDCMLQKTQDTVAVNHVLRNQIVSLAYLGVSDPQPFCQPARMAGSLVDRTTELFAETMEIHLSQQLDLMDFARKVEGAAQDASTNGYAILKVTLQSDYMKDPIGRSRFGDVQEQVHEFLRLQRLVDAQKVSEGDADYIRYKDLDQTLRLFAAGKIEEQIKAVPVMVPGPVPATDPMTGAPVIDPITGAPQMTMGLVPDPVDPRELRRQAIVDGKPFDILGVPELEHFIGFRCDQILPEDFRWDWSITRPEDWNDCDWLAHRVYMHPDEIYRKWGVERGELDEAGALHAGELGAGKKQSGMGSTNATAQDPNLRLDIEQQNVNDRVAVWELWHKVHRRRYVFVVGMRRFLENEVPQAVGGRFFPFFPIYFNRVTGWTASLSDVQLVRNLQDEINMLRSHDREARRAAYPVLFVPRGLMDDAAREQYRNRYPFSVIEVNNADEVKKYLEESASISYNPQLYNTAPAESQMQGMFGIPQIATGAPGTEDLASSVALSKEALETGVARRRVQINRVITDILRYMAEISLRVLSENTIKQTCGPMAVWPRLTAEELFTQLRIEVKGGLSGQPRAKDRLDLWMNFATIAQSLALPVNGIEVMRQLLDAMGIRLDFGRFIAPVPMQLPGQGPSPAKPPGGQGPDGGAPLMVSPERGAPSSLDQIPNHPPLPG